MNLFDFTQPESVSGWRAIDDVVMGGRSASAFMLNDEGAVFAGEVSLENNGGFASVRSPDVAFDLHEYTGVRLRVRGDGKRYGFILRSALTMSVRYQAEFDAPADQWATVSLPFAAFRPKVFGMTLPLAPPLNRRRITSCGLIISDKQAGPFRLVVAHIAAYHEA